MDRDRDENKDYHYHKKQAMSAEEVAKAFVQHFYQTFDAGVDALGGLFVSQSFFYCL